MSKLPQPKFNLRVAKAKVPTLISLVYRYRGKRLVYSTGYSILPDDWDFKTQRPIIKQHRPDLVTIKRQLDDIINACTTVFIESDYGLIEPKDFRDQLDIKLGRKEIVEAPRKHKGISKKEKPKRPTFFQFLDQELAEMKATNMKWNSYKVYQNHARLYKEFGKDKFRKKSFNYEDVDWNFRLKLIDWLTDKNVQLAYGNKNLKILKQFLELARRKKYHTNTDYLGSGWVVSKKKAVGQKVILNNDELQYLANMELPNYLDKVRDILLIGAGTGQRYSDFSRYTPNHFYKTINNVPILSLISKKTETPAKIPLNLFPWLIPVLEKRDYQTPKMHMQHFNDAIKKICEQAGFDEQILVIEQYMGRKARVEKSYAPKFKLVASHCCRRSFATNLYQRGYRLAQIMPMTGHSTESQLRNYIGIDAEENAELIALDIMKEQHPDSLKRGGLRIAAV